MYTYIPCSHLRGDTFRRLTTTHPLPAGAWHFQRHAGLGADEALNGRRVCEVRGSRIGQLDHGGHPDAAIPAPRAILAARLLMPTLRRLDARPDTAELS
mgnify:FL=1